MTMYIIMFKITIYLLVYGIWMEYISHDGHGSILEFSDFSKFRKVPTPRRFFRRPFFSFLVGPRGPNICYECKPRQSTKLSSVKKYDEVYS
jgi:hypothetical protein